MSIKSVKNAITSRIGRQGLKLQKHSPQLLFVAGAVGVVGTVVLASRATLKLEAVLDEHQKWAEKMEVTRDADLDDYTEDDYKKDKLKLYVKTSLNIAKLYGPSALLGVASIAMLTGAHVQQNRRIGALTAAYAALDKGFQEYRKRVIEEVGEEKERELRYQVGEKTIVEETAEGPVTISAKYIKTGLSPYARVFDAASSTSWSKEHGYNQMFLKCQEDYANDLLRARGHLFLNEVYDMLGLERSKEGQVVGWVLDGGTSDNFVDFGIFDKHNLYEALQFVNGSNDAIWLDFNVDGVVYDKI